MRGVEDSNSKGIWNTLPYYLPTFNITYQIRKFNMPESVEGRLTADKDQFSGRFEIDGFTVRVNGTFNPPVLPFSVPFATLKCNDFADLNGTFDFTAPASFVGQTNINLLLVNTRGTEIIITGALTAPMDKIVPIAGAVRWFHSFI